MFSFFKRKKKDGEAPKDDFMDAEYAAPEGSEEVEPELANELSIGAKEAIEEQLDEFEPEAKELEADAQPDTEEEDVVADIENEIEEIEARHEEKQEEKQEAAAPKDELEVADNFEEADDAEDEIEEALEEVEKEVEESNSAQTTAQATQPRQGWIQRLSSGLKRTGRSITGVFVATKIDDDLYEELEAALLMADAGTAATQYLLEDIKLRVKNTKTTEPAAVRGLLAESLVQLLKPMEAALVIGEHTPTVIMVAGVNGAGKTTSIGKLTRHLANGKYKVLLAAGDTFRAAAREQLEVWADRNQVEIVAQEGGDPASVSFDAVTSGKAKKADVVIIDTAGRLATQLHLMDELKKIHRVIDKAMAKAPHEVLLVVDGNTGQNALAQVKAFDDAIHLTGLIVTKLDGTAKGGVIAAIALWSQEREKAGKPTVPIYFIGVGEQVEDLQTFSAQEFANALLLS